VKTPISYYGGKQQLAAIILGMLPEHRIYCEPFCGGAGGFFAKEPSRVEIINDTNRELLNFYEVCRRDFFALEKEIEISLHSRKQHHQAWILSNSSYGCRLDTGFGYDRM
jgi:DNA adenine methylase